MNGRKKGIVDVPSGLTELENHSQLQAEVVRRAREGSVLDSHVMVAKVIVAAHGKVVNLVTTNS